MKLSDQTRAGAATTSSRLYSGMWIVLGAAALFYVTVLTLAPEALRLSPAAQSGQAELDEARQQIVALTESLEGLQKQVAQQGLTIEATGTDVQDLKSSIQGLGSKVAGLMAFDQATGQRLATLEQGKPGNKAGSTAQKAVLAPANPPQAPAIEGEVVPDEGAAAAEETPITLAPKKPAATDTKKTANAPKQEFAVELAMSTSTESLKLNWELLNDQHGDMLQGLSPRAVPAGDNFRLIAGPFANQAAATAHCAKLRKANVTCSVTPFKGSAL